MDGKCLSTFSQEELLEELRKRDTNGLTLCRIEGINHLPEFCVDWCIMPFVWSRLNQVPDPVRLRRAQRSKENENESARECHGLWYL